MYYYYERSEVLIDGDGKKVRKIIQNKNTKKKIRKKKSAKNRAPSPASLEILPASDSELRPRRSSGVRLAYIDPPSGERQRAPSTPRWGPSTLQEILRREIANFVHAAAAVRFA